MWNVSKGLSQNRGGENQGTNRYSVPSHAYGSSKDKESRAFFFFFFFFFALIVF